MSKLALEAMRRLERQKLALCYDSRDLDSRPSPKQQEFLNDIGKIQIRYIVSANQCLVKGTLVATPTGPRPIEEINVGDYVISEKGIPIKVLKTFYNGRKEVADLVSRNKVYASCTKEHVFLSNTYSKANGSLLNTKEMKAHELGTGIGVVRVRPNLPLGNKHEPHAYVIGALLGDGCSREPSKTRLSISSLNDSIPKKIAEILETTYYRQHESNYTWKILASTCNNYDNWCRGRYAHEKIVDLEIVKSWDRESLLNFVAGVFDTDGGICISSDQISLRIGMQAKSVVEAIRYAFLALWGIDSALLLDNRIKYKNGPVYYISIGNPHDAKCALKELDRFLVSPQKKWKEEYSILGGKRTREESITLTWGSNPRIEDVYDIHVDSDTNLYLLANGLVTHNCGKSSAGCREMAWILEDSHPFWKRPKEWGRGPLFMIIVGQSRAMISKELWERKIKPLLMFPEDWKEHTSSGHVMSVKNLKHGHEVQFLVHGSGSDEMRKQLQGYRAHYALFDEMPSDYEAFTEVLFRMDAYGGYMTMAFTPLIRNLELQNAVENAAAPLSRKYKWTVWDNPENLKPEKRLKIEQQMALMSDAARRTRYYGEWSSADDTVFYVDKDKLFVDRPANYSPSWRHVESVDPAGTGITGLTYWAQDPSTNIWYCISAEYIKGGQDNSPRVLVDKVFKKGQGLNIVRRIADTMPWFYTTASEMYNLKYVRPHNKVQRKEDLIKNLQEALSSGKLLITKEARLLLEELMTMRYSESGKIVQHQHWHVVDTAQYFVDLMPPNTHKVENISRDMWLMREHEKGKRREEAKKRLTINVRRRLRPNF